MRDESVSGRLPLDRRRFLWIAGGMAMTALAPGRSGAAESGLPATGTPSQPTPGSGLTGRYGFITSSVLGPQPEAEVRSRIATMAQRYGIREFQFYDWFADYSNAVMGDQWVDAYFRKAPISRRTIEIAIDEIHRQSGRAWAYVQGVGSEEQHLEKINGTIQKMIRPNGQWHWHPGGIPNPRFPTYLPNAAWATHMTSRWVPPIKQLGFDGIHWDTLGKLYRDPAAETAGTHEFLRIARDLLQQYGLRQTLNFVDLAWWDREFVRTYVEFPYVETWSARTANALYAEMDQMRKPGVFAMYPTTDIPSGWTQTLVIRARHDMAIKHSMVYLVIGDGGRRMKTQYWPDTMPLSAEEDELLRVRKP
jgi:hypothetical protein